MGGWVGGKTNKMGGWVGGWWVGRTLCVEFLFSGVEEGDFAHIIPVFFEEGIAFPQAPGCGGWVGG